MGTPTSTSVGCWGWWRLILGRVCAVLRVGGFCKEICTNNITGRAEGWMSMSCLPWNWWVRWKNFSSWIWWGLGTDPLRAGQGSCAEGVQKLLCVSEDAEIHGLEVIPRIWKGRNLLCHVFMCLDLKSGLRITATSWPWSHLIINKLSNDQIQWPIF